MLNEVMLKAVMKRIKDQNRWNQSHWGQVADIHFDRRTDEVFPEVWEGVPAYRYDEMDHAIIDAGFVKDGACETSFCFAGHTVLEAGDRILIEKEGGGASYCLDKDDNVHLIHTRAQQLLGLTLRQADTLFDGEAGDKDLERYEALVTATTGVTFE